MRKAIFAIVILFLAASVCSAADPGSAVSHYLLGQIRTNILFEVTIMEEVLPFNLDSPQVQYNQAFTTTVSGLRIGSYTLVTNTSDVKLVVSHTPLVNKNPELSEHNSINYRLYIVTGFGSPGFLSTLGEEVTINGSSVAENDLIRLSNKYLYVSLDEGDTLTTSNVVGALFDGTYESTITVALWVK